MYVVVQIDIPLSKAFYKWVLNQEATLDRSDLQEIDPALGQSYAQLWDVAMKKQRIQDNAQLVSKSTAHRQTNIQRDRLKVTWEQNQIDCMFILKSTGICACMYMCLMCLVS